MSSIVDDSHHDTTKGDGDFKATTNTTKETPSKKVDVKTTTDQHNDSAKRTQTKKSNTDSSSQASGSTSMAEDINGSKSASKSDSKEVVKMFFADLVVSNRFGIDTAYSAIYCPQKNIDILLKGEVLEEQVKSLLGFCMEGLYEAFDEAYEHGIERLHVVSQNKDLVKLMNIHQKRIEEGLMYPLKRELLPENLQLLYDDDYINYDKACIYMSMPGFEYLKFEYVRRNDNKYDEMVQARKLVAEFKEDMSLTLSQTSGSISMVRDLQSLHIGSDESASKGNNELSKSASKGNIELSNEVVKIFIAHEELGGYLAYYAIYCPQKNIKVIKGEQLERKVKTPLGYYMEALHDVFGEAEERGIKNVHIVSENEDAVKLMIDHQNRYEDEDSDMDPLEPEELLRSGYQLYYADDFINYNTTCYGIPGYESVKFEYVPNDDERYQEMVYARKLVREYIENTPMYK